MISFLVHISFLNVEKMKCIDECIDLLKVTKNYDKMQIVLTFFKLLPNSIQIKVTTSYIFSFAQQGLFLAWCNSVL